MLYNIWRKISSFRVMIVNINILKDIHRNHKEETEVKFKTEETWLWEYVCTKKDILKAYFNINNKELEETTLECDSCDYTCTNKDTLRIHKGVKHIAKLRNCNICDYSCTKIELPVMHKFRKHRGQEPPRKMCKLCDFTCLISGGFHQNAERSGLQGPKEFKCALCENTAYKLHPQ